MALSKRILLVDDIPDWRTMLTGLLTEEGYQVKTAEGMAPALELLAHERFHLAILDVRLDETDEGNTEGLNLMRYIKRLDPTIAVIMLSGYANVDMVQKALGPGEGTVAPAFDFVEKDDVSTGLLAPIARAFRTAIRINYTLDIKDEGGFLDRVAKRLKFAESRRLSGDQQLREEVDELFRKLFFDCEQITIYPMSQGFSGTAVVRVVPRYRLGPGQAVIVKFGERTQVKPEAFIYDTRVEGVVGGNRLPEKRAQAATRSLSGIIYSFVGATLGEARDFAVLYQEESLPKIETVLNNLFTKTCFPDRRAQCFTKDVVGSCNIVT